MSELIQFDGRTVAVIAPEDLEALEADNERLLGLLRKIDGILKSGLSASHQRLQIALLIEGAALRAADQPDAGPQAPIIRVSVDEFGSARVVKHYAPGLPPGEYDLYCEPEATAPMLRATDNAAAQPDAAP